MTTLNREEAITKIVDSLVEVYEQEHGWVREVLREGRVGFDEMTNNELEIELEAYFGEQFFITD